MGTVALHLITANPLKEVTFQPLISRLHKKTGSNGVKLLFQS